MGLAAGQRLGPYEVLGKLGAGGEGEVWRARDLRLERQVAVKVLPEALAELAEVRARFEREAKAVAALSHPNILEIHDFGHEGGVWYAVTELLEGETLRSRLQAGKPGWRQAVEIGVALAEGLAAAHAKGIVHRDLKPENIFLTEDGRVKILDFGLAGVQVEEAGPAAIRGTVGYLSPEQARGKAAGPASDLFSLGCVLYEMASGQRAFGRATAGETLAAVLQEDPPELLPAEFGRVVRRCLEKHPPARYQSAREVAVELRRAGTPRNHAEAVDSLAVLPFTSAGGPEAEYLGDGITENLINQFSQILRLRVVPRSTVFRYKGRAVEAGQAARELEARLLVTGRVVERGEMLSVQAELVDAAADQQLWGERFHRKTADLFEVEEEIARQITEKLRVKLTAEEERRLARRQAATAEAYQLYLKGRHQWRKRTLESLRRAVGYFEQAMDEDPGYAPAYAGLADCHMVLGYYGVAPPREAGRRAKAAALKAVELDAELAEAHVALGGARMNCDWDWRGAESALARAIELNPVSWQAYTWRGLCLSAEGRMEEAIAAVGRAQELDPMSVVLHHHKAWVLLLGGRYEESIEQCRRALELDPGFRPAYLWLGLAQEQRGDLAEALATFETARALMPHPTALGAWGHVAAAMGRQDQARQALAEMAALAGKMYVEPYQVALVHLGLGEVEAALEWLERAHADRSIWLAMWTRTDPRLDGLRRQGRLENLLRRIGDGQKDH